MAVSDKFGRSLNPYDYKEPCVPPPLCSDMTNVWSSKYILSTLIYFYTKMQLTNFLNRDDIRKELGVGSKKWVPCATKVEQHVRTICNNNISA